MDNYERQSFSRPTAVVIAIQAALLAVLIASTQPNASTTQQAANPAQTELAVPGNG